MPRPFIVGEKVIWTIRQADRKRGGYRSVAEDTRRAEIFAEIVAVGPKRIQIRCSKVGGEVMRWVKAASIMTIPGTRRSEDDLPGMRGKSIRELLRFRSSQSR